LTFHSNSCAVILADETVRDNTIITTVIDEKKEESLFGYYFSTPLLIELI